MKYLILSLITTLMYSCPKTKEIIPTAIVFEEEKPVEDYLKTITRGPTQAFSGDKAYEIGVSFQALEEGEITALNLNFPLSVNGLKVIIWDISTQKPIFSKVIESTNNELKKSIKIEPLKLNKNGKYVLSVASIFYYANAIAQNVAYPIKVKNISILGIYSAELGDINLRKFPSEAIPGIYAGYLTFDFKRIK
jgi:hypothetical protein